MREAWHDVGNLTFDRNHTEGARRKKENCKRTVHGCTNLILL